MKKRDASGGQAGLSAKEGGRDQQVSGRRPLRIGGRTILAVAAVGVVIAAVLVVSRRDESDPARRPSGNVVQPSPGAADGSAPRATARAPGRIGKTPINTTDPTSGEPIVPGIVSVYKGHVVGHCCETSKRQWETQTEAQKDAAIKRFGR